MNESNVKELRSNVRTDTTYGKKVLRCVELLKDRTGLAVTNLIQEALIAYEQITREAVEEIKEEYSVAEKKETLEKELEKQKNNSYNNLLTLSTEESVF